MRPTVKRAFEPISLRLPKKQLEFFSSCKCGRVSNVVAITLHQLSIKILKQDRSSVGSLNVWFLINEKRKVQNCCDLLVINT